MSFNKLLKKLKVQLHLPDGYNYCGDSPTNKLDRACLVHDMSYSKHRDNLKERHDIDSVLEKKALKRVLSKD